MSDEDYYKILEVEKTASDDEIIKAYRRLSKVYHPDRNPDKKEWAEENFKKINEAKNVLLDPDKRVIYDQVGKEGLRGGGGPRQNFNFNGFNDIFSNIFGGGSPFQSAFNNFGANFTNQKQQKQQQKIINIPITLEQVHKGFNQTKKMKIENDCSKCHGTGKSEFDTCGSCKGSGTRMFIQQIGPGMIQQSSAPCHVCNQAGKVGKGDDCSDCGGKKTKEKIISINVNFPPGIPNNIAFRHVEENIEFIFIAQIEEHSLYKRDGNTNNLLLNKKINLLEALCGTEFNLRLLCGKEIIVKSDNVIKPNTSYKLPNLGIAGGEIIINFEIEFPDKVEEKDKLESILKQTVTKASGSPNTEIYYIK